MMTEKFGGVHVRGVGNFLCSGTRDLRVAARANCPVCSVSCSAPAAVTEIQPVTGTPHSWHLSGILGQCERYEIGAKLAAPLIVP